MSTIFRDEDGTPIEEPYQRDGARKCSSCNVRRADGHWRCIGDDIFVCYWCAVRILPALIADAMAALPNPKAFLIETHEQMSAAFWRAAALALVREPGPAEETEFEPQQAMQRVRLVQSRNGDGTADGEAQ